MFVLELLQNLWQYTEDNPEFIGVLVTIGTPAFGGLGWLAIKSWKRLKRKKRRVAEAHTFPYEVIRPRSLDVVQRLYGSQQQTKDDPLADFNIGYQQRLADCDVQQVLMEKLIAQSWLLILGRTGLGKTREAAEIAQRHSHEGWTVMRLENHQLLTVPDSLPIDQMERQPKLLFVLDNLNQAMVLGQQLPTVNEAGQTAAPLKSPLQMRLLETLQFYTNACGQDRVRVIATARDEREKTGDVPSEWEKLQVEKYPNFWRRFEHYELPSPEDWAVAEMLITTATAAGVKIQGDLAEIATEIARINDQTFRNPVENLRQLKTQGKALSLETFQQKLKEHWARRYRKVKALHGERGVTLYDGVDLLRQARVTLTKQRVILAAQIVAGNRRGWQWWWRRQLSDALTDLERTERLLEPRDGQIEAKGYSADLNSCFEALCQRLQNTFETDSALGSLLGLMVTAYEKQSYSIALDLVNQCFQHQPTIDLQPILVRFKGIALNDLGRYEEAIASYDQALVIKPDDQDALYNKGNALFNLGRYEEAIASFDQALVIKPDRHEALNNKGSALGKLDRYDDAIAAFDQALVIKPDKHEALNNKGISLRNLGRYEEAIAAYDQALVIKPDDHKALEQKALALAYFGKYEDAIAAFDQAIAINSEYAPSWYNKACAHALFQKTEQATTCLQTAIELSGTDKYVEMAKTDTDFDSIRNHPSFQSLITPAPPS